MSLRLIFGMVALSLIAAACAADDGGEARAPAVTSTTAPPSTHPPQTMLSVPAGTLPDGPSALADMSHASFPEPLVNVGDIISGGPPPDGIPPIDDPQFVTVTEADEYLTESEPVVYVEIGGDARAYPVQILIWHEIVNDTVNGVPITVTYCPLCNSAVSYVRVVNGVETTFGTSGRLYNSALVMYDRATESLWTHFDGRAVVGTLTGLELDVVASPLIGWGDFKTLFPEAMVLDRGNTGHRRSYGSNPYVGYDDPDTTPFLFFGDADDRAAMKQRVVGVSVGEAAAAWPLDRLAVPPATATAGFVGTDPIVIFWKKGQATALEGPGVDDGRDVGSVAVFSPVVDGLSLTFSADADGFIDAETASRWTIGGRAISGELSGTKLEQIPHLDTFWFAWSSYRPGTELVQN